MIQFYIRQDLEPGFRPRSDQRYSTGARSRLRLANSESVDVKLLDISISGFGAECDGPVAPGEIVFLFIEDRGPFEAKVRWASGGQIGCEFRTNLEWPVLVALLDLFPWHAESTPAIPLTQVGLEPSAMKWTRTADVEPSGDVLVFSERSYCVAILVKDPSDGKDPGVFMDSRSADLVPWPSHWMPLPDPPES